MGNKQDRGADIGPQAADEIEYLGLHRGVEAGGWLVEDQQLGVGGQCHGDHDPLQHAAR